MDPSGALYNRSLETDVGAESPRKEFTPLEGFPPLFCFRKGLKKLKREIIIRKRKLMLVVYGR
jgi:hypothetical protein